VIRIGTAGWSLYRTGPEFEGEGTALQRYSRLFNCTEINSSFYRAHARTTYATWAAATPTGFRFAVKVPQHVTHELQLRRSRVPLQQFAEQVAGLGRRLGPWLVQLPPSLAFERRVARTFFASLRERHEGPVVCEPRHSSWFSTAAESVLDSFHIGRVAADPAPIPEGAVPGGWGGVVYYRLHGSPRRYWSVYEDERLETWARSLAALPKRMQAWCIFDNTAGGGAIGNAQRLMRLTATSGRADRVDR
jgi:uncharacterized protein YecE (DUF72 family)